MRGMRACFTNNPKVAVGKFKFCETTSYKIYNKSLVPMKIVV